MATHHKLTHLHNSHLCSMLCARVANNLTRPSSWDFKTFALERWVSSQFIWTSLLLRITTCKYE